MCDSITQFHRISGIFYQSKKLIKRPHVFLQNPSELIFSVGRFGRSNHTDDIARHDEKGGQKSHKSQDLVLPFRFAYRERS